MSSETISSGTEHLDTAYNLERGELIEKVRVLAGRGPGVATLENLGRTAKNCIGGFFEGDLGAVLVGLHELLSKASVNKSEQAKRETETLRVQIETVDTLIAGFRRGVKVGREAPERM